MFDNFKKNREANRVAIEKIEAEIEAARQNPDVSAKEVAELIDMKRKIQRTDWDTNDILKVVANVAIVAVIVGFEMSHVMNQKGSRFLKVL